MSAMDAEKALAADEKLRRAIYSVWPGLAQNHTRRLVAAITAALPPCGHEAEIARLRKIEGAARAWLASRDVAAWSPGWSDDLRRGYDAAVKEVRAALAEEDGR